MIAQKRPENPSKKIYERRCVTVFRDARKRTADLSVGKARDNITITTTKT